MFIVDRSAAIIRPKADFLNWLNQLPGNDVILTLDEIRADCTVLMVPEAAEPEDAIAYIDEISEKIFSMELASWVADDALWPQKRNLKMFWDWFDVEIHLGVMDAVSDEIHNTPTDHGYH
ncbi:hypothetical protein K4H28_06060 [Deefgea tanakiae]|jgi:hypothetical protein|uniref:Uncharacterized protein n=1 Tax=Deefgea tanakiae TaxID=2865840 RepID=A0ABX8Z8Q8_9NEIS|nr:hypothetical protein [Deefgea tanakiae]QZA78958.1 hypothetical protein K4H28_06060 [Deefgea tanakiae]